MVLNPSSVGILLSLLTAVGSVSAQGVKAYRGVDSVHLVPADRGPVRTFLTPSREPDSRRFWLSIGAAGTIYTGFAIGLWEAWYKDYELESFHTFNDRDEWLQMDKAGHTYTAYHYTRWAYSGLRWSGTPSNKALLLASGTSLLLQSTVEVMDGFSAKWGFSWYDMAFNVAGTASFVGQELAWKEQRFNFKVSNWREAYPSSPVAPVGNLGPSTTLAERAKDLYGATPWQRFLKDYNAQTIWLSANPAVLIGRDTRTPWLNLAVGYSGHNLYGGFANTWTDAKTGYTYDAGSFTPRQREWYLSLDLNLERIPTKSPVLKTVLLLANHIKIPAPALRYRHEGGLAWEWLHF